MRALPGRRGAAWIAATGSAALIVSLAACAVPATSQRGGPRPVNLADASTAPVATATPLATGAAPSATASPTTTTAAAGARPPCPPLPPGGLKLNPKLPPPPPPPRGSTRTHAPPQLGCAYVKGYADVRKLNGASLVGPGLLNLAIGDRVVFSLGKNYFQQDSAGQLDYQPCRTCRTVHGLPPARATFLAFGFMPVSATLRLTEVGTINIYSVGTLLTLSANTAWSRLELRVDNVDINGKPLDVGPHCQTTRPLLVKLIGLGAGSQPYSLQDGGPLTGEVTIPPFTGCGVTENLDPLFTGTVSGPGNFAKFTQGSLCTLIGDLGCPPPVPRPVR